MTIIPEEARKVWKAVAERFKAETGKQLDQSNIKENGSPYTLIQQLIKHTHINLGENSTGQTLYDNFYLKLKNNREEITIGDTYWNALNEYGRDYLVPLVQTETVEVQQMETIEQLKVRLEELVQASNYREFFKAADALPLAPRAKEGLSLFKLEFEKATFTANPFFQQRILTWIDNLKK